MSIRTDLMDYVDELESSSKDIVEVGYPEDEAMVPVDVLIDKLRSIIAQADE